MASILRGKSDATIETMIEALAAYEAANDQTQVGLYRQNSVSVRIRIIDPSFKGLDKSQRQSKVWPYLDRLPEEVQSDISMLLLLAPDEAETSFANFEFNDPVPSRL